ncbi:methionine--tRNA ligase [Candidatus Giovannonibacteria bacterium RIFCSPLOWO2_02_FULL_45_14]|uniref:Methionine--tRNA ligase n=3 Tax=Parcubacteria group TaxID=1794811 RepID=A0A0H4TCA6_9BACT|nr:methionyl-tRNA synthetase, methionyl-tRNA synthetase [uncultured Parcubacteria bacterium Rifle_16ft_4_minimus_37658]AKQ05658.1 methionyl-tRNA synthetase, methionyl-tRNA synthetase [uncultured Parcubacteria bacterium Rifle_16ft_4_minimus_23641]OGF69945.1 MAG: methionine--tRNA ligase [Candidatus Giovannonibacteria bacterium RIFCSPHIGHO2_02_FULL_44_31]OGF76984.1 MAG: methionine--tRNA ligase [Candidatus Giovannonibacteria bacterium RIFCSPHIGHO2_12_FULL_44_29]OGF90485.1 MAG: methionine--tRNA liga
MAKFYITTTLPYVNAPPHIGFALELVRADIIARYHRLLGDEVIFNTGTDEHGLKVYRNALKENKDPKEYVDMLVKRFVSLKSTLNVSYTNFIRTTDPHHKKAAQEFWNRCSASGDIYKQLYSIKYCVGCELEKTESELDEYGRCPIHPNLEIEIIEEENYFFRWSKYQEKLLELYSSRPDFVLPSFRMNELRNFVSSGLRDFSITRRREKMPWGVAVPEDDEHVMYVWFDALVNYISTLGWPEDEKKFKNFWPGIQIAGKDNLRQQAAMWQAMLMSAGLPCSKQILINGFIESGGHKMSKSLGNVVDPTDVVGQYGTDALRYWFAREVPAFDDGDFTQDKFAFAYEGNLVNGLGNYIQRVSTMVKNYFPEGIARPSTEDLLKVALKRGDSEYVALEYFIKRIIAKEYREAMEKFELTKAIDKIFELLKELDVFVQVHEPFKLIKKDKEKAKVILWNLCYGAVGLAWLLIPFLPETSDKIFDIFGITEKNPPAGGPKWDNFKAKEHKALFPRIEK